MSFILWAWHFVTGTPFMWVVIACAFGGLIAYLGGMTIRACLIGGAIALASMWSAYCWHAGFAAADAYWRAKNLEATIEQLKADLAANEEILKDAAIDASAAEDRETKLKELLDALAKKPGTCPLTDDDVDGVSKIDSAP